VGEAEAFQIRGDANAEKADRELERTAAFSLLSSTFSLSVSPSAGVRDCLSCPLPIGVGDFVTYSWISRVDVEGTKTLDLFASSSSSESLIRVLFTAVLVARGFRVGGTFSSCSSVSSPDPTVSSRIRDETA
jgi:hypothetical protein